VAHTVHDTVFLIIENIDYTIGYKTAHPQTDLQKLLQKSYYGLTYILHTFHLHFCTLISFSVITLNYFTTNFLICTELQSGIVNLIMTQSLQVPLCRLRHLYQGEITRAILQVMNPINGIGHGEAVSASLILKIIKHKNQLCL
jgi:hypothetical protein